jgi:hypothetical protein
VLPPDLTVMNTPDDDNADGPLAGTWYADRFRVGRNAFEFKIDCGHERTGQGWPEQALMAEYFRVITNPVHAQQLFRLLGVALVHYCDAYGLGDIGAGTTPPGSEP